MKKLTVYNLEGQKSGETEFNDQDFFEKENPELLHQVSTVLQNNQRVYTAHTKSKDEVRGGGKKPWKQKGTGRARAGSIRSPLWKGGGVTFGPRNERNYVKKINKKTSQLALALAINAKVEQQEIKIIDNFEIEKPKTKKIISLIKALKIGNHSILLVLEKRNLTVTKSGGNIPRLNIKVVTDLNTLDLMKSQYVLIEQKAWEILKKDRLKKKSSNKILSEKNN